jgi:hypothetical protein
MIWRGDDFEVDDLGGSDRAGRRKCRRRESLYPGC